VITGYSAMRRTSRRLRNMFAPGAVILLYHRVTETDCDPWGLAVTPKHFAEHLDVLRQYSQPLALRELNEAAQAGRRLRRTIAVTFDDGYADNFQTAKPLLERYDIPASVFVVSGYVGNEREFWWYELERLLLQPGTFPETVRLRINGKVFEWQLGESATYGDDEYRRHRGWRFSHPAPTLRHALYYSLWRLLGSLGEDDRRDVLDQLLACSGADPLARPNYRPLSVAELLRLHQGQLIEIGSHTVTHPFLSRLPEVLQRDEIRRSKAWLESLLGFPVTTLAYPHGDYTMATVNVVREAGFECACSTIFGSVRGYADRFQLPRIEVQGCDGEEFARKLSRWFRC
jgi:peptidoglycan/xylan/chitin deacetylase (PgdA/CDA1 family)